MHFSAFLILLMLLDFPAVNWPLWKTDLFITCRKIFSSSGTCSKACWGGK